VNIYLNGIETCSKIKDNGKSIYQENAEKYSQWCRENLDKVREKSNKQSKLKNSKEWKETIGKEKIEKYKETISSKEWKETIGKEKRRKRKDTTSSKEWQKTTGKDASKKQSKTKSSKEWQETKGKRQAEKISLANSRKDTYNIYREEKLLMKNVIFKDVVKIAQTLIRTTKERPLGCTRQGKVRLNTFKKLHLIGMYVIKIK